MRGQDDKQHPGATARAIQAVLLGVGSFSIGDALMKLASVTVPTGQTIAVRGLVATALMTLLAGWSGALRLDWRLLRPAVLLRTAGEVGASIFFFSALYRMPIADCTAILQVVPLALTAAGALLLGEAVGWRRWLATLIGFGGVLLIVRPGTPHFGWPAVLALLAVVSIVVRDISTRRLPPALSSLTITWLTVVAVMLSGFALEPLDGWLWPSPTSWLMMATAGVTVIGGNYFLIAGMRGAEVGVLAPFRYAAVIFALIAGYLVWGEVPDGLTLAGIGIVLAAGLYTLHRERVRRHAPRDVT